MKSQREIYEAKGNGYIDKQDKICMIRCFECGKENYAMNVSSGFCTWCGYNPNSESEKSKRTKMTLVEIVESEEK